MLTLFVTIFKPYNYFAPVFSTAVIFILLAGLTLIPSIFALLGRPAFWPFIPRVEEKQKDKKTFWTKISTFVTKHPAEIGRARVGKERGCRQSGVMQKTAYEMAT